MPTKIITGEEMELCNKFHKVAEKAIRSTFDSHIMDEMEGGWSDIKHKEIEISSQRNELQAIAVRATMHATTPLGGCNFRLEVYFHRFKNENWFVRSVKVEGDIPSYNGLYSYQHPIEP